MTRSQALQPFPSQLRRRAFLPLFAAALLVLLATAPAFAAAPVVAPDASVWALSRYEVDVGGDVEYQIPIDLLAFASDEDGDELTFEVTSVTPAPDAETPGATVLNLGSGLVLFRIGVTDYAALAAFPEIHYQVRDATGLSTQGMVTISQPQSIYLPAQDAFEVAVDEPTPLPVLDNDNGFDSIVSFTQGDRGEVSLLDVNATALLFTPDAGFAPGDTDVFTYTPYGPHGEGPPTLVTVTGVAPVEPVPPVLQVVRNWGGQEAVTDGSSVAFPDPVQKGQADSVRFNFHNPSSETIEITNATTAVSGDCFSVLEAEAIPPQVAPDASPDPNDPNPGFRLRVQCSTSGEKTATVQLETRTASGTVFLPFTFTVTAQVVGPPTPLLVRQRWNQVEVTNGAAIPFPVDAPLFENTSIGFDVENTSTETIEITNAGSAVNGAAYSITPGEPVPTSIAPGEILGFRLRVYWDAPEIRTGVVTLETQSASDAYQPFSFSVTTTFAESELDVFRGWPGADPAEIVSGEVVELPTLAVAGDVNHSAAFQISNERGFGTLVIDNADTSIVSGPCFNIRSGGLPEDHVLAGNTTPFRVWWGGSCGPGTYTATVRVESNAEYWIDPLDDDGDLQFTVVGRVAQVPVFTCEPADAVVSAGGTATFTVCTEADNGTLTFAWFKDGQPVAGSGATLTLSGVSEADEGSYHVEVSNELGTTVSQAASLSVVSAPVVTQPADQTTTVGSAVTFSVTVTSPPEDGPFSFQWQELPPGAPTFQSLAGANSASYTVTSPTLAMDGTKYRCVVSNDVGQTNSGPGRLTVQDGPTITQQPQSQRVVAGDDASFSVAATGTPAPDYAWRKDGVLLGVTTPTLSLAAVADADEGLYKVRVSNSVGYVDSQGVTLTVVEKPVVSKPADRSAAVGGSATFSVTVSSPAEDGPFTYKWQKLPPGASTFQTLYGATGSSYTVTNVTQAMDGTKYRCLVNNDAGQTNSGAGKLSILTGEVQVTRAWDGVVVGEGSTFDFGTAERSVTKSYRFKITNTGPATLTISNPTAFVSGTCWSQIENAASSVAPGASTYFRVRLLCGSTGTKYGTVSIQSSDPSSPYAFSVRGTVVASDVTVYQNWTGSLQGANTTLTFPSTEPGVSVSRRFRITNTGQATLTISNPTSLVSGTCWSQIENAASSVAPGASTYFRVRLLCSSTGTKSGTITINSNDPSTPYRFYVQGTVSAPDPGDVTVYRAWNGVVQGEGTTFPFPDTTTGTAVSRRFQIKNTGSGTLTISNPTSLVSGTCWSQIENAASSVAPGASTYFRVRLLCSSTGTKNGTVTLYSNDTSSPYRFYLQGTVN